MAAALHGDDAAWTRTHHLLAAVVDHLAIGNWQRANSGVPKSKRTRPPHPIPRPGARQEWRSPAPDRIARIRARTGRAKEG